MGAKLKELSGQLGAKAKDTPQSKTNPLDKILGSDGEPVNALLGTANLVLREVEKHEPRAAQVTPALSNCPRAFRKHAR